jgi:hypothetical protein
MPHNSQTSGGSHLNPTSKMSFAVAGCAFAAAGIGLLINQWMSGWMAVGGMAGVGLFYMAIGLLNLGSNSSIFTDESDLIETASHRLSGATNVDDLAIQRPEETVAGSRTENLANARK